MTRFIILFLMSSSFLFATPRDEAQKLLEHLEHESNLSRRLDIFSKNFLGTPYGQGGPLGEGPGGKYDQDPLYRFDTFDCTTYVETIMALALARSVDEFEAHLDRIRYKDGEVDYLKRNHFTDLQWIPFNVENGYMSEINHLIVPPSQIKIAEAIINFPGWLRSHKIEQIIAPLATLEERKMLLEELYSEAPFYQVSLARVPYVAINKIISSPAILNKVPTGTIVNFVRPNWDLTATAGTHQNISHQGLLFKVGMTLYLRHASTSGEVEQIPFIDYLKRFRNHATLKGVHFMSLNP